MGQKLASRKLQTWKAHPRSLAPLRLKCLRVEIRWLQKHVDLVEHLEVEYRVLSLKVRILDRHLGRPGHMKRALSLGRLRVALIGADLEVRVRVARVHHVWGNGHGDRSLGRAARHNGGGELYARILWSKAEAALVELNHELLKKNRAG